MKRLTFGSLFSGIGGFDLGLERAGMECMWQVEIDPYARDILAQHWPDVLRYADVRDFPPNNNPEDYVCDLICGGFPCQDNSKARYGGLGLDGPKSGLWAEFARVLRLLRPRYAIVENVPTLRRRGLDRVLGDLADLGYDAEWSCCPATAVGAPHVRNRLFIVAHPRCEGLEGHWLSGPAWHGPGWLPEPNVGRVADGVPDKVDRIRTLGNAIVPTVAELIGRWIIAAEAA